MHTNGDWVFFSLWVVCLIISPARHMHACSNFKHLTEWNKTFRLLFFFLFFLPFHHLRLERASTLFELLIKLCVLLSPPDFLFKAWSSLAQFETVWPCGVRQSSRPARQQKRSEWLCVQHPLRGWNWFGKKHVDGFALQHELWSLGQSSLHAVGEIEGSNLWASREQREIEVDHLWHSWLWRSNQQRRFIQGSCWLPRCSVWGLLARGAENQALAVFIPWQSHPHLLILHLPNRTRFEIFGSGVHEEGKEEIWTPTERHILTLNWPFQLDTKVNIIPIIAKADTISKTELQKFKVSLWETLNVIKYLNRKMLFRRKSMKSCKRTAFKSTRFQPTTRPSTRSTARWTLTFHLPSSEAQNLWNWAAKWCVRDSIHG